MIRGDTITIGQVLLGRYEVLKYINSGGTGDVYIVKHLMLDTELAMKVVNLAEAVSQDYINEAHTLKSLRHAQLPRIVDIFEIDGKLCIIRDFIEGLTLEEHIARFGPMTYEEVIDSTKQLLNVLMYLHKQTQPIIYRDLKPSNIIVVVGGDLSLIDFGTTRTFVPGQSMDTVSLGTMGYAAPEQYGGNQSDARTDIYGLGAVMYYMYTGEHYSDVDEDSKFGKFITPSGKKLLSVIEKAMAFMQEDRYASAEDMLKSLTSLTSEVTEKLSPKSMAQPMGSDGKVTVGVMGLTRGVGTTHIAMALASTIQRGMGKVCYIERETTGALNMFERFIEDLDVDQAMNDGTFKYKGILFSRNDGQNGFRSLSSSVDTSMVIDYANHHYLLGDYLRNQYKFFVIPSRAWAIKHHDVIEQMKTYQDVVFIANLATKKSANDLVKWLALPAKRVLYMPYTEDVFGEEVAHTTLMDAFKFKMKKKRLTLFGVRK